MSVTQWIMDWSTLIIIFGTACWILLRVVEKVADIMIKVKQYESYVDKTEDQK